MATGDQQDMFMRLKRMLSPWFGNNTPILDALLQGCASTDAFIYSLIEDANLQTRIKTATGYMLDYISQDYFGDQLPRHAYPTIESDDNFRHRILVNLIPERATRNGLKNILFNLTGREPTLIEGFSLTDGGCYDATFFYDNGYGYGFDSTLNPYTGIIYAYLPLPQAFYAIGGYDNTSFTIPYGGWTFGYDFHANNAYVDINQEESSVTENDIIAAIRNNKVFGTRIYLYIPNSAHQPQPYIT